jgi:inositol phosphorylceramide mannosyltransferase catalytic subunit
MASETAFPKRQIPYSSPGIQGMRTPRAIPYTIIQTFKTRDVPVAMHNAVRSWIDGNPEYAHEFFDDARMLDYVANEFPCEEMPFPRPTLLKAFHAIRPGAGKADLFRYLIMFDKGGVYMDVDTVCLRPLRSFVRQDDQVLSGLGRRGDFHQWGLIYIPRHPFMRRATENTVSNIINRQFAAGYNNLEGIGGPPCLDQSIKEVLKLSPNTRFAPGTYAFADGARTYRFRILDGDFFGNNVGFKYKDYHLDLQRMGIPYWAQEALFND